MTDILDTVKTYAATMDNFAVLRGWIDALVAEVERVRDDLRREKSVREFQGDLWMEAEGDLAALRQRHAEVVEAAFREGFEFNRSQNWDTSWRTDAAWLASEAKARLT